MLLAPARRTLAVWRLLAAAFLGASVAQASIVFDSVYDTALPEPHAYFIGLGILDGTTVAAFTVETYYTSPLFDGDLSFASELIDFSFFGMALSLRDVVLPDPTNANRVLMTGGLFSPLLYTFRRAPPAASSTAMSLSVFPDGFTADGAGAAYVSTPTGVKKLASTSDGTVVLTFGDSGPGTLNGAKALAMGPDGLIYVMDAGNNRIVSFDSGGVYQDEFSLAGLADPNVMVIGSNGWLYTADGLGGGLIYDIYLGTLIGSLNSLNSNPDPGGPTGGKTSLAVAGNQLYLYDTATGLHVFQTVPEPSTWALMLIGGTVGLIWRKSRADQPS